MTVIAFIISVVALACGCAALIIAMRESKKQTRETVVRVEKAPVEHPFTYDGVKRCYTLDGNLEVTGSVSALKKGGKA